MGLRGELFSTRMACDGRTYFFNVKENRMGDLFLSIVESKPTETGDFDRRSIVVFQDNADEFLKAFTKSLEAMNEAAPSERSKPPRTRREAMAPRDDGRDAERRLSDDEKPRHYIDTGKKRDKAASGERGRADRDSVRRDSVRRDIEKATGRSAVGPNDDRRARTTGRVLRVKKAVKPAAATPEKKPAGKRLTVKKVPKRDE
ncbi:MAG TPA: DUF3276 family protein [Spirochaetia bacterium]|nr:DUF3276 family protein [Spirochaetaceae bacterium]HPE88306.1 DUF3276 family protein [Spirochaetales bacterium]HRW25077.1 DUF3276 family protein [Spirochaetia bacterium]